MLTVNYEAIPGALTARNQWLVWRLETREGGKPTKIPYNARTGKKAKSNDPSTWCDFNRAGQLARKGDYDGVGFAFAADDGLVGIDMDHVFDPETGTVEPWAMEVIGKFSGSYIELSPSGTGFRIYAYGTPTRCGKGTTIKAVELYNHSSPRYLTVTGNCWPGCSAEPTEQQAALDWLHERFFLPKAAAKKVPAQLSAPRAVAMTDQAILDKALKKPKFAALWHGEIVGGDHSSCDLSLCCMLAFWFGGDSSRMDAMFRASGLMREKWDVMHGGSTGRTYGQMTIDKALAVTTEFYDPHRGRNSGNQGVSPKADEQGGGGDGAEPPADDAARPGWAVADDRPKIQIGGDRLVTAMQQAERVIFRGDIPPYFQRGGILMRLAAVDQLPDDDGRIIRPTGVVVLAPVTSQWIRRRMMQDCCFVKWNEKTKELAPVNLPEDYAKNYLSGGEWWSPVLKSITHAPFMRADGTIAIKPGYDPKSGVYLANEVKIKPLPKREKGAAIDPAKDEAIQWAFRKFDDLFGSFEVETPNDFAVLVSAVLAGLMCSDIVRPPGIVITAPVKGTGKGKLASMISMILTGQTCAKTNMSDDPNNFQKTLFASLLAGDKIVCLDEIEKSINSGAMNSALTEDFIKDRVLGFSQNATVRASDTMFFALGNNVQVAKDGTRRWLRVYLRPSTPEPHKRIFARDPVKFALEHRQTLITAGLTILSAFAHAGCPQVAKDGLGSFEGWNYWIRNALIWAGFGDPVQTMENWKEQDSLEMQSAALLAAWYGRYGNKPKKVAEVIADMSMDADNDDLDDMSTAIECNRPLDPSFSASIDDAKNRMKSVLDEFCLDKKAYCSRRLGARLKKDSKRIFPVEIGNSLINLSFVTAGKSHQAVNWKVVVCK
jgi:hypothetical protein